MLQALLTIIRAILVEFVDRLVRRLCTCCGKWETTGEKKDKRNLGGQRDTLLGILLAAAAAVLCVCIDYVTKKEE